MASFYGYIVPVGPVAFAGAATIVTGPLWVTSTTVFSPSIVADQLVTAPTWSTTTAVATPSFQRVVEAPVWTATTVVSLASIQRLGELEAPEWNDTTAVNASTIAGPVNVLAWSAGTTVALPSIAGPLTAAAWTATTTLSLPVVAGPLTSPSWSASTAVQVSFIGALVQAPAWAATTSVNAPTLTVTQSLNAATWIASTAVLVPVLDIPLQPPVWVTSTAVTTPTLAGPLRTPTWAATTVVRAPQFIRRSVDFRIQPAQGFTVGNAPLILFGTALDMTACTPNFVDGQLDSGFWTDLSAGDGEVLEVEATRALRLNTGVSAGSVAGARTTELAADLDVEVSTSVLVPNQAAISEFELGLYVSTATDLRLVIRRGTINLVVRENNQVLDDRTIGTTAGNARLRLLRVDERVFIFLGGVFVVEASWVATNCNIELVARNNAALNGQVATRITRYLRRPVVLLGDTPLTSVEVVDSAQATATVPARQLPGAVDARLTGCSTASDTIVSAFTYNLNSNAARVFNDPTGPRITAIGDAAVTGRIR